MELLTVLNGIINDGDSSKNKSEAKSDNNSPCNDRDKGDSSLSEDHFSYFEMSEDSRHPPPLPKRVNFITPPQ